LGYVSFEDFVVKFIEAHGDDNAMQQESKKKAIAQAPQRLEPVMARKAKVPRLQSKEDAGCGEGA